MKSINMTFEDLDKALLTSLALQYDAVKKKKFVSIPYVQGSPGIGKSEYMKSFIREYLPKQKINGKDLKFLNLENANSFGSKEWSLVVQYLATFPLEKLTGLPKKTEGEKLFAEWTAPDIFDFTSANDFLGKNANDALIVLFLDDVHLVKSNMSPYLFQLFSYRSIHGYNLPDNVLILCAGNGPEDNSGYQKQLAAIINRHIFYKIEPNVEQWTNCYAIKNNVRSEIITFLNHAPNFLYTIPVNEECFCSPRSWVGLSDHMNGHYDLYPDDEGDYGFIYKYARGLLSPDAVSKYSEYVELILKWEAEKLLNSNKTIDVTLLSKIEAYSLLSSVTGYIMKLVRTKKTTVECKDIVERAKKIFLDMSLKHRVIVPMSLRLLVQYEMQNQDPKVKVKENFSKKIIYETNLASLLYNIT